MFDERLRTVKDRAFAVPVATLGAAAARLSTSRRNDRLATLRLLGATSGEVCA